MPVVPVQTRLAPPSGTAEPLLGPSAVTSASGPSLAHFLPPSPSAAPSLDLRIDSLVLHGFSAVDGRRVGAAFEEELALLVSSYPSPLSEYTSGSSALAESLGSSAPAHLSSEFAPGRPELTGRRAARALHARLRA